MATFRSLIFKKHIFSINKLNAFKASTFSSKVSNNKKLLYSTLGIVGTGALGLYILDSSVSASEFTIHATPLPWAHKGIASTFDHASLRRGFQVYKEVCAACHSLQYNTFRHLTNVTHTEAEVKELAAEYEIEDGPNEEGAMFMRPGKPTDFFPSPYANEEAARFANNGSYPPDLTFVCLSRHGGEDYIYSILTGYCEPPAGVVLPEGASYNPYFPGASIGMAQALYNGSVDYEDGTPATASQCAKDVSSFLRFTAEIHHDARKRKVIKTLIIGPIVIFFSWYLYRRTAVSLKYRKIFFKPAPQKK